MPSPVASQPDVNGAAATTTSNVNTPPPHAAAPSPFTNAPSDDLAAAAAGPAVSAVDPSATPLNGLESGTAPAGDASSSSSPSRSTPTAAAPLSASPTTTGSIAESKQKARAIMGARAATETHATSEKADDKEKDEQGEENSRKNAERTAVATETKEATKSLPGSVSINISNGNSTAARSEASVTAGRKRSRSGSRRPQAVHSHLPARTKESFKKLQIEQYVNRHLEHEAAVRDAETRLELLQRERDERTSFYNYLSHIRKQDPSQFFGSGYSSYNNNAGHRILFPQHIQRRSIRSSRQVRMGRKERSTQAEQTEELVPIRVDLEWDKVRLRDTFTWNLNDRHITPRMFAERLVEDFGLPLNQYVPLIQMVQNAIVEQLAEHHPHIHIEDEAVDPTLPYTAYKDDELRIVVKLNITIGPNTLVDQIEWDINNPSNSPEDFARQMASELSLGGEFATAIAHSIREQCQLFTRSLYVVGHAFDGRPVDDHELAASFMPSPLQYIFRPYQIAKDFSPMLWDLNEAELEKTELSVSREERRQKRSVNRRGGPALPDLKDRPKTLRTLLVSTVLPRAVEDIEESRLFKRVPNVIKPPKRGRNEDSDDSDSDESLAESAVQPLGGTARTNRLRAPAASQRASHARSITPGYRETTSPEPTSMVVKLKIGKAKLQQFLRDQRSRNREPRSLSRQSPSKPLRQGSMGPPTGTPLSTHQSLPAGQSASPAPSPLSGQKDGAQAAVLGRVRAAGPPSPENPIPPPPDVLLQSLDELRQQYPNDDFEALMRLTVVSNEDDKPISVKNVAPLPDNCSYWYYPRIRCKDCPGKLYTPDANLTASNFDIHLRNKTHKERVKQRLATQNGDDPAASV